MSTTLDTNAIMSASSFRPITPSASQTPVYFFLDLSNIFVNAIKIAPAHGDGAVESTSLRLSARHMRRLVQGNREWADGYAASGINASEEKLDKLRRSYADAGIHLEIRERGVLTGREQGIDEMIQCEMLHLLSPQVERGVVALATGDGRPCRRGNGFLRVLQLLHESGFGVELLSWKHSLNPLMQNWVSNHGRVIELDDYFGQLTYIQGGRQTNRVSSYA